MDDDLEPLDRIALERWRGRVDAFMAQSSADRVGIHAAVDRFIERSDRRHGELVEALKSAADAQREAVQVLTASIATERQRIDRWEARAEGASWLAKLLPHTVTAAITSALWWLTGKGGGGPPGPMGP